MNPKVLFSHILAALAVGSLFSAGAAFLLRPFFHGYFDEGSASRSSGWVKYFDLGILSLESRAVLALFGLLFVLIPIGVGYWLARHNPEPSFDRWYGLLAFGGLLVVGVLLNLAVSILYFSAGFHGTNPF